MSCIRLKQGLKKYKLDTKTKFEPSETTSAKTHQQIQHISMQDKVQSLLNFEIYIQFCVSVPQNKMINL